jgi:hypothetical protein
MKNWVYLGWPGSPRYGTCPAGTGATYRPRTEPGEFTNAANVQSKVLWRFSEPYMRDWRVGEVRNPRAPLAFAVVGSSAFPPVLWWRPTNTSSRMRKWGKS